MEKPTSHDCFQFNSTCSSIIKCKLVRTWVSSMIQTVKNLRCRENEISLAWELNATPLTDLSYYIWYSWQRQSRWVDVADLSTRSMKFLNFPILRKTHSFKLILVFTFFRNNIRRLIEWASQYLHRTLHLTSHFDTWRELLYSVLRKIYIFTSCCTFCNFCKSKDTFSILIQGFNINIMTSSLLSCFFSPAILKVCVKQKSVEYHCE